MSNKKIPVSATDFLMHVKADEDSGNDTERVLLPFTRYANVFNAPNVISDIVDAPGAPFVLYSTDSVTLTDKELHEMCGDIL